MSIALSHISALEILRLQQKDKVLFSPAAFPSETKNSSETAQTLNTSDFVFKCQVSQPVHITTLPHEHDYPEKTIVAHKYKSLLLDAFLQIDNKALNLSTQENFLISSPELCFLQMASILNLLELIQLGFELCGKYSLCNHHPHGFFPRNPLTTTDRIQETLNKLPGFHFHKKAQRALSFVLPNSASPRETSLTMILYLPYSLGGYNLGTPLLNHPITSYDYTSHTKKCYFCDLYWPEQKVAVEYDSDQFHTGSERLDNDAQRRNRLLSTDIIVIAFTRKQLNNLERCNETARTLARHLNKRIRPRTSTFASKQLELRSVVLRTSFNRDNFTR